MSSSLSWNTILTYLLCSVWNTWRSSLKTVTTVINPPENPGFHTQVLEKGTHGCCWIWSFPGLHKENTVISVLSVRLTFYSDYRTAMIIYALVTEVYPAPVCVKMVYLYTHCVSGEWWKPVRGIPSCSVWHTCLEPPRLLFHPEDITFHACMAARQTSDLCICNLQEHFGGFVCNFLSLWGCGKLTDVTWKLACVKFD